MAFPTALTLALAIAASAAPTMDGFVGLFNGACPKGWSPLSSAQGRLLLAVNNSFQAGATVNFPLSDGEDRQHSHAVAGSFDLGTQQVSALGGSNTDAAHAGKQPLLGFLNATAAAPSGFPFVQLTACRYNSISFEPPPSLPGGGVALWDPASATSGCPAGSAPLAPAAGRLLALANATGLATNAAVPPLEPGQDIQHTHQYSVSISLDSLNFDGIHGCCDNDVATHGPATATGTSSPASLGLPYLSILTCNTTSPAPAPALPLGMVLLTTEPCPAGWAPSALAGRAVVATPPYGVPGKVWGGGGGALLTPAAPYPAHGPHAFDLDVSLYPVGVELASSGGGNYGRKGEITATGATLPGVVGAAEQLPLVLVLACERSA